MERTETERHPDPQLRLESMSAEGLVEHVEENPSHFRPRHVHYHLEALPKGVKKRSKICTLLMIKLHVARDSSRPRNYKKLTIIAISFKTTINRIAPTQKTCESGL
jgi:hypothetical protein